MLKSHCFSLLAPKCMDSLSPIRSTDLRIKMDPPLAHKGWQDHYFMYQIRLSDYVQCTCTFELYVHVHDGVDLSLLLSKTIIISNFEIS